MRVCLCACGCTCVFLFFFYTSLYLCFSLISNLHLTPCWGKASHSSTVFVPVTSRAPPAYQYQLRQCWACNLQLNVILLNPIWKLNIEKPLAYLPVFLPPSLPPLLAAIPPAFPFPPSHSRAAFVLHTMWHLHCFVCAFVSYERYSVELILIWCQRKKKKKCRDNLPICSVFIYVPLALRRLQREIEGKITWEQRNPWPKLYMEGLRRCWAEMFLPKHICINRSSPYRR